MNFAHTGFFVLAPHHTLQDTFWTRFRDLIKGLLLYGTINWRRASDGLKPPKLTPLERKIAMPSKNLDVIKPRENPQAALVKTLPKKVSYPKVWDVTAGAIVSDPLLSPDQPPVSSKRFHAAPPSGHEMVESLIEEQVAPEADETVVVRRRRRHHRHGLMSRRTPRSPFQFGEARKPGLLARWFGSK